MKHIRSKIAMLAIVASVIPSWAGDGGNASPRNCTWCHGTSGQGFTTAPRLAGQRYRYVENQLLHFHNHLRDNPLSKQYMWPAATYLNQYAARDLAIYFSRLPPRAANDGNKGLAAIGQAIYQDGIPEANIVSCVVCHGPQAEGVGQIPRLGGLAYVYLKRRLEEWGEGYHLAAEPPMPRIASKLGPDEIEALASYLSFVE
jgi:cytochrome c553